LLSPIFVNYSLLTIHYSFFLSFIRAIAHCACCGLPLPRDLASVGTVLVCWSASSNAVGSGNAGDLWCHAGDVKPLDVSGRAYGFSVRCVQNLRLLFIFHAKPEDKALRQTNVAKLI